MELCVILPVYNESNRLAESVCKVEEYLTKNYSSFELIIVEDNSTDGSYDVARSIARKDKNVVLLHNERRLGRGASLSAALKKARGGYAAYMDVDLATDLSYLDMLIAGLDKGAVVSTGSRYMNGADVKRPLERSIASRSYNGLVRLLFKSKVLDHQCGFKGFDKNKIIKVLDLIHDNHWFWDTELLIICQAMGMKIFEFPVKWVHNGGNNMNASKVKVLKDSINMGQKMLELKRRLAMDKLPNIL
jgi:glycosyltransferase AglD